MFLSWVHESSYIQSSRIKNDLGSSLDWMPLSWSCMIFCMTSFWRLTKFARITALYSPWIKMGGIIFLKKPFDSSVPEMTVPNGMF